MKKQILNTIGLAVVDALFCVPCSHNGLTKNPNSEAGDANALTGKFYGKDNPTDPCVANPAPGCQNYCEAYPTAPGCPGYVDPCADPTPDCSNYCQVHPDAEQCKNDPCADPTPDCSNYCQVYPNADQCKGDPCAVNPTPDCQNYCEVYPTMPGCPGYNPCIANPNAEGCQPEIGTFTDSRDRQIYKKVTIGTQTWMAENLNYGATNSKCYDNDLANCDKYGRLYNWSTAMGEAQSSSRSPSGVQGACPAGWHIPSEGEWTALTDFVGSTAGTKLKSSTGWNSYSGVPAGTDEYGFSALPGGYGSSDGSFGDAGNLGNWWSATESGAYGARGRYMNHNYEYVRWNNYSKTRLFSVRCVQN
jgi:uncharacterized protein (TIGR02145 family)